MPYDNQPNAKRELIERYGSAWEKAEPRQIAEYIEAHGVVVIPSNAPPKEKEAKRGKANSVRAKQSAHMARAATATRKRREKEEILEKAIASRKNRAKTKDGQK